MKILTSCSVKLIMYYGFGEDIRSGLRGFYHHVGIYDDLGHDYDNYGTMDRIANDCTMEIFDIIKKSCKVIKFEEIPVGVVENTNGNEIILPSYNFDNDEYDYNDCSDIYVRKSFKKIDFDEFGRSKQRCYSFIKITEIIKK